MIAARFIHWRHSAGLTIAQASRAFACSNQLIYRRWETGERDPSSQAVRLLEIYEENPDLARRFSVAYKGRHAR